MARPDGSILLRNAARWRGARVGLLGGSFNPAHAGHRHISLEAMKRLRLDAVWWLVSPGNPLKAGRADMAPMAARLASARRFARHPDIMPTGVEARLGTRYTVDTLAALTRLHPTTRFIWLMGGDNLQQFHRWKGWRTIARLVPIAVLLRPGYAGACRAAKVLGPLRPRMRPARRAFRWCSWRLPALVCLDQPGIDLSSTMVRKADPLWAARHGRPAK